MEYAAWKQKIGFTQHISWMTTAYKIHDADKIGSVVSEDDILHLFEEKDSSTVPPSKLSGALAKNDKEALRRAYEKNRKSFSRSSETKANDWDLKKQVYQQHKGLRTRRYWCNHLYVSSV